MSRPEVANVLQQDKQALRQLVWSSPTFQDSSRPEGGIPYFPDCGLACERLRAFTPYRQAAIVFIAPDQVLAQARLNALNDTKLLIVATPGLRQGFVEFDPRKLRFHQRRAVVTSSELARAGTALSSNQLRRMAIDLFVTGSVAVDLEGNRLGKGAGFFDLEYSLLAELGAVAPGAIVVTVVAEDQIVQQVPVDDADVPVDSIVTPLTTHVIVQPRAKPTTVNRARLAKLPKLVATYRLGSP